MCACVWSSRYQIGFCDRVKRFAKRSDPTDGTFCMNNVQEIITALQTSSELTLCMHPATTWRGDGSYAHTTRPATDYETVQRLSNYGSAISLICSWLLSIAEKTRVGDAPSSCIHGTAKKLTWSQQAMAYFRTLAWHAVNIDSLETRRELDLD